MPWFHKEVEHHAVYFIQTTHGKYNALMWHSHVHQMLFGKREVTTVSGISQLSHYMMTTSKWQILSSYDSHQMAESL
jgi:hypothetical protein